MGLDDRMALKTILTFLPPATVAALLLWIPGMTTPQISQCSYKEGVVWSSRIKELADHILSTLFTPGCQLFTDLDLQILPSVCSLAKIKGFLKFVMQPNF